MVVAAGDVVGIQTNMGLAVDGLYYELGEETGRCFDECCWGITKTDHASFRLLGSTPSVYGR